MNTALIKQNKILIKYNISKVDLEEELECFIDYWTEPNQKGKERWQFEKTFCPNRRFLRWLRNKNKWEKNNFTNNEKKWQIRRI